MKLWDGNDTSDVTDGLREYDTGNVFQRNLGTQYYYDGIGEEHGFDVRNVDKNNLKIMYRLWGGHGGSLDSAWMSVTVRLKDGSKIKWIYASMNWDSYIYAGRDVTLDMTPTDLSTILVALTPEQINNIESVYMDNYRVSAAGVGVSLQLIEYRHIWEAE